MKSYETRRSCFGQRRWVNVLSSLLDEVVLHAEQNQNEFSKKFRPEEGSNSSFLESDS